MVAAVAVASAVRGALRGAAEGDGPEAESSGAGARREPAPAAEHPQDEREGERPGAQEEAAAGPASPQGHTPAYGAVCVKGRRPAMEDRVTMKLGLLGCEGCEEGGPLHFFAVYDGHGGKECATLCSQRLHGHLAEELRGLGLGRLGLGLCAPCHLAGVDLGAGGGAAAAGPKDVVVVLEFHDQLENVLDLFGGSGSTLIGCEQTDRNAFLMELDELYCDVIVKRWEAFTGKQAKRIAAKQSPATQA